MSWCLCRIDLTIDTLLGDFFSNRRANTVLSFLNFMSSLDIWRNLTVVKFGPSTAIGLEVSNLKVFIIGYNLSRVRLFRTPMYLILYLFHAVVLHIRIYLLPTTAQYCFASPTCFGWNYSAIIRETFCRQQQHVTCHSFCLLGTARKMYNIKYISINACSFFRIWVESRWLWFWSSLGIPHQTKIARDSKLYAFIAVQLGLCSLGCGVTSVSDMCCTFRGSLVVLSSVVVCKVTRVHIPEEWKRRHKIPCFLTDKTLFVT
jgi:hypothetical protein